MIITIDGYIATGKSTIAKRLSEKLGFIYFDTGAMYRCLTYGVIHKNVDINHAESLQTFLDQFIFEIKIHHGDKRYFIEGVDVSDKIRAEEVTNFVSQVSALGAVREKLVTLQRELALGVNAVFEGRDMGTIVFPEATLKIFLTGRPELRAQRRFHELKTKYPEDNVNLTLAKTLEEINRRDLYDSTRALSPLQQAADAYEIDTSDLSVEEIVDKILELLNSLPAQ